MDEPTTLPLQPLTTTAARTWKEAVPVAGPLADTEIWPPPRPAGRRRGRTAVKVSLGLRVQPGACRYSERVEGHTGEAVVGVWSAVLMAPLLVRGVRQRAGASTDRRQHRSHRCWRRVVSRLVPVADAGRR